MRACEGSFSSPPCLMHCCITRLRSLACRSRLLRTAPSTAEEVGLLSSNARRCRIRGKVLNRNHARGVSLRSVLPIAPRDGAELCIIPTGCGGLGRIHPRASRTQPKRAGPLPAHLEVQETILRGGRDADFTARTARALLAADKTERGRGVATCVSEQSCPEALAPAD